MAAGLNFCTELIDFNVRKILKIYYMPKTNFVMKVKIYQD